jgi:transcriptional regulator with XRE-family HTH domain
VSQSAYSKIELGESEVTFTKLEKISEALGMKPEEVIAFNESMVFNVIHNNSGYNGFVDNNNQVTDNERLLYQDQINLLKEEVSYLKQMLEKLLK